VTRARTREEVCRARAVDNVRARAFMRSGMTRTTTTARRHARGACAKDASRDERDDVFDEEWDDDGDEYDDADGDRVALFTLDRRSSSSSSGMDASIRRRSNANAARRRDDEQSFRCGWLSAVVAIVMFMIGFGSIGRASYSTELARERQEYAAAIERWETSERRKFADVKFEWGVFRKGSEQTRWIETVAMSARAKEGVAHGVATYDTLRYALKGGDLIDTFGIPDLLSSGVLDARDVSSAEQIRQTYAQPPSYTHDYNNTAVMEALTGMWSLKLRVKGERVIDVVDVELFQKEFLAISNWKTCKYQHAGFSTRGGCEIYSVVDRVCLKLKVDDTNGEWSVDSEGGSGCQSWTRAEESGDTVNWVPVLYHRVLAPSTGAFPSLFTVRRTLARIRESQDAVMLRASTDPRLWLLRETGGTTYFANAEARLNATGIAIVVIAAVFTVPATCLLIPLMFEKIAGWSTARGRAAMEKKFAPTPMREMV